MTDDLIKRLTTHDKDCALFIDPPRGACDCHVAYIGADAADALEAMQSRLEKIQEWVSHHRYCEWQEAFLSHEDKPGRRFDPMSGTELHCTCGLNAAIAQEQKRD